MKVKKRFVCKECGYVSASWIGKCPECLSWNSFIEELIEEHGKKETFHKDNSIKNIQEINTENDKCIITKNEEINNFFGDGITSGSVTLITGEPGIGKSTLLFFIANSLSGNEKVYYFSGEESLTQIKKRAERVGLYKNIFISNQVEVESIIKTCSTEIPDIIFIDSIQTIYSENVDSNSGSISQIKYSTEKLINFAKKKSIPVIIIGHITKSGELAGPKVIEHMVDVVIYFDAEFTHQFRILRSVKNRFGGTDDILLFEMKENGLILINNPSGYFLDKDCNENITGRCRSVTMEGQSPLVVEVEALVVPSVYSNPRRFSEGVDIAKISRIAAILDKHLNQNLNNYDIYVNILGGIKTKDVGLDLAIASAIYSSKNKLPVSKDKIILGELSLTGKIRGLYKLENRIKEAKKFNASLIICPKTAGTGKDTNIRETDDIIDAVKLL